MQPATKPCKYCKAIKEGMESYKCDKCYSLSHLACMKCKKPSRLKGDFLFLYECKDCNFQKKDILTRMKLSWVQIIHLALYNLTVNERGRQGYFRWKEEICVFIEKNWNILMPGKTKPPTWIGTIAGTLSVHSHKIFKSGQIFFNETGWWALQEVTIPKANAENYRANRPVKSTPTDLINPKQEISTDLGRGKRQRKSKDRIDETSSAKSARTEPCVSQASLVSPANCVKSVKPVNGSSTGVVKPTIKNNKTSIIQEIKTSVKATNKPPSQAVKRTENVDPKPMNSQCAIMAELKDAGYSTAVQIEDPFASLFDDMSVFDLDLSSHGQNLGKAECTETHFLPIEQIKKEPLEQEETTSVNLPKAFCKPLQNLNSIKPIERVSNVKPLTVREEAEFLSKLDAHPLTVESDCSVRRLRRKLLTRKRKRELGIPLFSINKNKESTNKHSTTGKFESKVTETSKNVVTLNENKPKSSFNHPALVGVNVLDKFCNIKTNIITQRKSNDQRRLLSLIGIADGSESYQSSIVSPYTSRILKPYIRRDFSTVPPKLSILRQIQQRCSIPVHRQWPIDYCYVQPSHIPAVNSLCNDFFWVGIDLTECLQYPEFSCVVMYRKLVIGFAFMVPDVKFNEAYISFILVHPDWRRSGIASNMIYHLIQTCMGKDITLHVSPSNPSMLLYQKFGFKAEALILDFYKKYMPDEDAGSKHAFLLRLQR